MTGNETVKQILTELAELLEKHDAKIDYYIDADTDIVHFSVEKEIGETTHCCSLEAYCPLDAERIREEMLIHYK